MTPGERQLLETLKDQVQALIRQDRYFFSKNIQIDKDIGVMFGLDAKNKLAFYGAKPVVQQTTTGSTGYMTAVGGSAVLEANGFKGYANSGTAYTIGDVVGMLKAEGLLPA